jgi:hypothetical protein
MFGRTQEKLQKSVDSLVGDVGRLQRCVDHLTQIMGRIVFPAEAMNELTGELRAIRQLMDEKGRFAFMDKERENARAKEDFDRRANLANELARAQIASGEGDKPTLPTY